MRGKLANRKMAAHYDRSVNVLAQSIVTFLASDDASSQVGREKPRNGASRLFGQCDRRDCSHHP